MRIRFLSFACLLFLISCSASENIISTSTPEEFARQLVNIINERDEAAFKSMYMNRHDADFIKSTLHDEKDDPATRKAENDILELTEQTAVKSYSELSKKLKKIVSWKLEAYKIEEDDLVASVTDMVMNVQTIDQRSHKIAIKRIIRIDNNWKSTLEITLMN